MKTSVAQLNFALAWLWILLGFASGMVLGLFFHRTDWLGGYGSFQRRMYRLAHISFFGLGATNLLFCLSERNLSLPGRFTSPASWALIAGGISMPICCLIMAQFPRSRLLFAIPVLSLITGALLTLPDVMRL